MLAAGATPVVAPETNLNADVDAILARVTARTKVVFLANPNNPTGTYLGIGEVRRLRSALPGHVLLVLDAAYAEYVRRNDYEAGLELVATTDNTVMTRTFSKILACSAAHRLGLLPARRGGRAQSHPRAVQLSSASIAAGAAAMADERHIWRPCSTTTNGCSISPDEIGKLGLPVTPSVANFVLIHFPEDAGRGAVACDTFLKDRRASSCGASPATACRTPAPHRRYRCGERTVVEALAAFVGAAHERSRSDVRAIALIGIGLIGSSISHAARRGDLAKSIVGTARTPATVETAVRLGIIDAGLRFGARSGRRRGSRHPVHAGRACAGRSPDIPRVWSPAPF